MRGYFSFVLVFSAVIIIFTIANINVSERNYDRLAIEKDYFCLMNNKEIVLELLFSGAKKGFQSYDETHDIPSCSSCPDYFCIECNPLICSKCFRIEEAIKESKENAHLYYNRIQKGSPEIDIFFSSIGKNGYSFQKIIINEDIFVTCNTKQSKIPRGYYYDYN